MSRRTPRRHRGTENSSSAFPPFSPPGGWGGISHWFLSVSLCLCGGLLLPACSPGTLIQKAGADQDIARDINWELRKDPRFELVSASCIESLVTLQGRVASKPIEEEALRLAESRSHGARVVSKLEIRPR